MGLFRSTPNYLKSLFKTLQCKPGKVSLYTEALSHKSGKNSKSNYERLEFLGDAILSAVITDSFIITFLKKEKVKCLNFALEQLIEKL